MKWSKLRQERNIRVLIKCGQKKSAKGEEVVVILTLGPLGPGSLPPSQGCLWIMHVTEQILLSCTPPLRGREGVVCALGMLRGFCKPKESLSLHFQ